jgi:hypothetical protein
MQHLARATLPHRKMEEQRPPEMKPMGAIMTVTDQETGSQTEPSDQTGVADLQLPPEEADETDPANASAHPVYYSKIVLDSAENRLDFVRTADPPPPVAYRELRKQIEDVARLVRTLFQNDQTRSDKFLRQLHLTADSGLRGANSDLDVGADNLLDVKNNIADEFPAVRGKIWWWNFGLLGGALVVSACASAIYRYFAGNWVPMTVAGSSLPAVQLAIFLIPLGVMLGLFVEFIFRVNDDIPYESLRNINPGRWKPFQRALNTTIVGYIFAGILGVGAFQIGVANVLLNDFLKEPILSLAIGFVTGLAFPYVRDLVQQFRPVRRDGSG